MIKSEKLRKVTTLALSAVLCASILSPAAFAETGTEAGTETAVESSAQAAVPKAKKSARSQNADTADTRSAAEQAPVDEESAAPATARGGKAMRGPSEDAALPESTPVQDAARSSTATSAPRGGKATRGPSEDAEEPENAIGRDAAVSRALAEAGISAGEAEELSVRVTKNTDGATVYRVKFISGSQRYSYEIGAVSGDILHSDVSSLGSGMGRQDNSQSGSRQGGSQQGPGKRGGQRGSGQQPSGGQRGNQQGKSQRGGQPCPYCGGGSSQGLRDGSCATASPDGSAL